MHQSELWTNLSEEIINFKMAKMLIFEVIKKFHQLPTVQVKTKQTNKIAYCLACYLSRTHPTQQQRQCHFSASPSCSQSPEL